MDKQSKLIKDLYEGLRSYYSYADNLEAAIESCGDTVADVVYEGMPDHKEDNFNHKDCRFLLSEVEDYFKEKQHDTSRT